MIEIKDVKDYNEASKIIRNDEKDVDKKDVTDEYLNDLIDELLENKKPTKYTFKNFLEDTCYIWSIIGLITACINIYHCIKWLKESFEEY